MKKIIPLLCAIFWLQNCFSQTLVRRSLLGIAYETAAEHTNPDLPRGVEVKFVVPKSSAEKAGLQSGDLIINYEKLPINSMLDFKTQMRNHTTGDKVNIRLVRKGEVIQKKMELTAYPKEENPAFITEYDQVNINGNRIRTILTKPRNGKNVHPTVYIIQGIGCSPMENPFHQPNSIYTLVDSLTRAGFATMRMERSGVGDSRGTPCQEIGFGEDFKNFQAGLKKLQTYDFVDQQKIFLIGLSMGGLIAPMMAKTEDLAGLIIYGSGGKDWHSYELENTLRQAILEGIPPEELNEYMMIEKKRLHYFFIEKKTPDEIEKIDPEMAERCRNYPLHYSYFQEVADVDLFKVWSSVKTKVLAIHGNADYVSSGKEHELIAYLVNQKYPGKATYVEFPESDHWMNKAKDEKASFNNQSEGTNPELISFIKKWIKQQL